MSQYATGTISTLGSPLPTNVISGSSTAWVTAGIAPGDILAITDSGDLLTYQIQSVDSETQITLTANLSNELLNAEYSIDSDLTPRLSLLTLNFGDVNVFNKLNENMLRIDEQALFGSPRPLYNGDIFLAPDGSASVPAFSFLSDSDTGLYLSASNELSVATGGTQRWKINSTGDLLPASSNAYDIGSDSLQVKEFSGKFAKIGDATGMTGFSLLTLRGGHFSDGGEDSGIRMEAFEPNIEMVDLTTSAYAFQQFVNNFTFYLKYDTDNSSRTYANTAIALEVSTGTYSFYNSSNTLRFQIEGDGTLNVGDTPNYEDLVTDNDDIPNALWVQNEIATIEASNSPSGSPILENGWSNYNPVTHTPAGYYKTQDGIVHLEGLIKDGTTTSDTLLFTLPAGYRPYLSHSFATICSGPGVAQLVVNDDGTVRLGGLTGTNGFLQLDCCFKESSVH